MKQRLQNELNEILKHYINSKLKTRTGIPDLKTEDGSAVNDEVKADMFNKFFSSLFY